MKRILLILSLFLFGIVGTSQAYSNVSFSFSFNDALSPYGSWVNVSSYGQCWRPRADYGWRPYTQGHWIYTSYGPMFDSPEPYGWAVYHYGRWVYSASYGWIWAPGYDWYPSRVTWAYGDDYLGWSPIYPSPGYNANFWMFIDRDHFGYRDYSRVYFRGDRVRPLFDRRAVRIQTARLDRRDFERIARRPVQVVSVRERTLEADRHRVKMIVPQHREATAIQEVSRASKKRIAANSVVTHKSKVITKQSPQRSNEVTTKYHSTKKVEIKKSPAVKSSSRNTTFTHKSTVNKSPSKVTVKKSPARNTTFTHKSTVNRSPSKVTVKKSSQKSHVTYSNKKPDFKISSKPKTSSRTSSVTHKSSVRQIPQRTTIKQSSPKSHVVTSKYSSSSRSSSKQVKQVSRKEAPKSTVKKAPVKQQSKKRPPRKH